MRMLPLSAVVMVLVYSPAAAQVEPLWRPSEGSFGEGNGASERLSEIQAIPSSGYAQPDGALRLASPFRAPEVRGPLLAQVFPNYSSSGRRPSPWGLGWQDGTKIWPVRENGPVRYDTEDLLASPWGVFKRVVGNRYQTVDGNGVVFLEKRNGGSELEVQANGAKWWFVGWGASSQPESSGSGYREYVLRRVESTDGWQTYLDWNVVADQQYLKTVRYGVHRSSKDHAYEIRFEYVDLEKDQWQSDSSSGFFVTFRKAVSRVRVLRRSPQNAFEEVWRYEIQRSPRQKLFLTSQRELEVPRRRPVIEQIQELTPSGQQRRRINYADTDIDDNLSAEQHVSPMSRVFVNIVAEHYKRGVENVAKGSTWPLDVALASTYPDYPSFVRALTVVDVDGDLVPEFEYRVRFANDRFDYIYAGLNGSIPKQYPEPKGPISTYCRPHEKDGPFEKARHFVHFAAHLTAPQVIAFIPPGVGLPPRVQFCQPNGELIQEIELGATASDPYWTRANTVVADLDGDRMLDLVRFAPGGVSVRINESTAGTIQVGPKIVIRVPGLQCTRKIEGDATEPCRERHDVLDYNGDGIPDITEIDSQLVRVWLGAPAHGKEQQPRFDVAPPELSSGMLNSHGKAIGPLEMALPLASSAGGGPLCGMHQLIDVTGDGWADLLSVCRDKQVYLTPNRAQELGGLSGKGWSFTDGQGLGFADRVLPIGEGLALFAANADSPRWLKIPLSTGGITMMTDSDGQTVAFHYERDLEQLRSRSGIRLPVRLNGVTTRDNIPDPPAPATVFPNRVGIAYEEPFVDASNRRFYGFSRVTILRRVARLELPLDAKLLSPADAKRMSFQRFEFKLLRHGHLLKRFSESYADQWRPLPMIPIGFGRVVDLRWGRTDSLVEPSAIESAPAVLRSKEERVCKLDESGGCANADESTVRTTELSYHDVKKSCPIFVTQKSQRGRARDDTTLTAEMTPDLSVADDQCRYKRTVLTGQGPEAQASFREVTYAVFAPDGTLSAKGRQHGSEQVGTTFKYKAGRLVSALRAGRSTMRTYDVLGRLKTVTDEWGRTTTLFYEGAADQPSRIETQRGGEVLREYRIYRPEREEHLVRSWYEGLGGSKDRPDLQFDYVDPTSSRLGSVIRKTRVVDDVYRTDGQVVGFGGTAVSSFRLSEHVGEHADVPVCLLENQTQDWEASSGVFLSLSSSLGDCSTAHVTARSFLSSPPLLLAAFIEAQAIGDEPALRMERIPGTEQRWSVVATSSSFSGAGLSQTRRTLAQLAGKDAREIGVPISSLQNSFGETVETSGWATPGATVRNIDARGRLISLRDGVGTLLHRFDEAGRLVELTRNDRTLRFTYHPNTDLVATKQEYSRTGELLRKDVLTYDRGQLTGLTVTTGNRSTTFRWIHHPPSAVHRGLVKRVKGPGFSKDFDYDALGRTTRATLRMPDEKLAVTTTWTLGVDGTVLGRTHEATLDGKPWGTAARWQDTLSAAAVRKGATIGSTRIENIEWNVGHLEEADIVSADGKRYRVRFTRDFVTDTVLKVELLEKDAPLMAIERHFGDDGLTDWEEARWENQGPKKERRVYAYDSWARLARVAASEPESYGLDPLSSLQSATTLFGSGPYSRSTTEVSWATRTITWNAFQQASQVDGRAVVRRPDGVAEAYGPWKYFNDEAGNLLAWGKPSVEEIFVQGGTLTSAGAVQRISLEGVTLGYTTGQTFVPALSDFRGSTWIIQSASVQRVVRTAFGAVANNPSSPSLASMVAGFAGGVFVPGMDVLRMGLRDYDPKLGQFLSEDPYWQPGYALHAYAHGNPVDFVDPSGAAPVSLAEFPECAEGGCGDEIFVDDRPHWSERWGEHPGYLPGTDLRDPQPSQTAVYWTGVNQTISLMADLAMLPLPIGAPGEVLSRLGTAQLPYRVRLTLGVRLSRFFASRVGHVGVGKSMAGRLLIAAWRPVVQALPSLGKLQQHHVLVQAYWGRIGPGVARFMPTAAAYYAGLQRLGNGGWNLLPLPAALNNALGHSPVGTALFATGVYGVAIPGVGYGSYSLTSWLLDDD